MQELPPEVELFPAGSGAFQNAPLAVLADVVGWVELWCGMKPTTGCVHST